MADSSADRNLLFGLLALQNGMVDQGKLVGAFQAWTLDKAQPLADHLVSMGHIDADDRAAVDALVAYHLKKYGGSTEQSLAAVPAARSTCESLARLRDSDVEASLARVGIGRDGMTDGNDPADRAPDRWRRVCEAFASVLRRDPAERSAHLGRVCGDDDVLRADVERLLADDARADSEGFLALPDAAGTEFAIGCDGRGPSTSTTVFPANVSSNVAHRFRILRPHARGGLGAVFVAMDAELHREVALKQILDRHADDPASRARFLLEAEINGGLEHPGIVPVYSLGSYADGRPFYAMRFIRGETLKEVVDRFHSDQPLRSDIGGRSLELRKLLRRFIDVCNAVSYAHSRGVLHRDIKPGNIIVGKHGETLMVDWGLAKAMGRADPEGGERTLIPSSASGSAETLPGSALGTPSYMSPEQAEGDLGRLGASSDVYSLGATLYYLLTGRPPVAGEAEEVLRAVQRGDVTPPRRHDATIDRALEAVCLKAMAHRPADRYASPKTLTEDVERWMADEPVAAWLEPLSRRVRRWATRNRTAVAMAVVGLLAGVVGLSAVLIVQARANTALAAANDELGRSRAAVQARYDLAVHAIKTFHTGVSEDFLVKQDQFKELRDRLLKSAASFYGKLGALLGQETDIASRRALAASNFELAALTSKIGRKEEALAAHRAVLAAREALAAEPGTGAGAMIDVGLSLTEVAALLQATGKSDEALSAYHRSEALLAGLTATEPSARAALASSRSRLGGLLSVTGKMGEALAAYRQARDDQEAVAASPGASNDARRNLADTLYSIGVLLSDTGQPAEAETVYRRALAMRQKLADENPGVPDFRSGLAESHNCLGFLLSGTGRPAEAEAEYRRGLELQQGLAKEYPAVTDFRSDLADSHNNLGSLMLDTGRPAEAEAKFLKALDLRQRLAEDNPTVTRFASSVTDSHNNLGALMRQTGRPAEAEAELRRALGQRERIAAENPAATWFGSRVAGSHSNLGVLLLDTGRPMEAETEYRRALALRERTAKAYPAAPELRGDVAASHNKLGSLLLRTGRLAEAEAEHRTALALYRKLADENPTILEYGDGLASSLVGLGDAVRLLGRVSEARAGYDQAIALRERLVRESPSVTAYRVALASSLRRRGLALHDLGDPAAAAADSRRARDLLDGLPSPSGEEWFETACCHAAIAGLVGRNESGVSTTEAASEAEAAMAMLRQSVGMGYRSIGAFRIESALDPLRNREDFRLLTMDLAMPVELFAPAR